MGTKRGLTIAYIMASVLLVLGVVGYAAFPEPQPEEPVRLLFRSVGGKVLFDHKIHTAESGYGFDCTDCHHMLEEGETPTSCGDCHEPDSEDPIKRSEAFHQQCIGCHETAGGPTTCSACHVL